MSVNSATQRSVSEVIHPKDQMFTGDIRRYMSVGADALARIRAIASIYDRSPTRILDFACGCGRVARHLRSAYPHARLVVSDVMRYAVDFCAENFEASPHFSSPDLADVVFDQGFDLIWSGSLMTHLNEGRASQMFDLLARSLNDGGIAIWTTHGRYVEQLYKSGKWPYKISGDAFGTIIEEYRADRYGYTDYPHMAGYGISITPLRWLSEQIRRHRDIRVVSLIERGWDEHQDVVAIMKRPI